MRKKAYGPGGGGGWGLCGMRGVSYDRDETDDPLPSILRSSQSSASRSSCKLHSLFVQTHLRVFPNTVGCLNISCLCGGRHNDACVPYIGSQAWTSELANNGWSVAQPWSPCSSMVKLLDTQPSTPALQVRTSLLLPSIMPATWYVLPTMCMEL